MYEKVFKNCLLNFSTPFDTTRPVEIFIARIIVNNERMNACKTCYVMNYFTHTLSLAWEVTYSIAREISFEESQNKEGYEVPDNQKLLEKIPLEKQENTYFYSEDLEYTVYTQERIQEIGIEKFWNYIFHKYPIFIPYFYKSLYYCNKCGEMHFADEFYAFREWAILEKMTPEKIIGVYCPICLEKILDERKKQATSDYLEYIMELCERHTFYDETVLNYRVNNTPMVLCECCAEKVKKIPKVKIEIDTDFE